jgi:hypothetical protein
LSRRYTKRAVRCTPGNSTQLGSRTTHNEYCDLLLTVGLHSPTDTAAWICVPRYFGRRHADTNVFRRLEQRLCETGSDGICECRSPTNCMDTSQWKCHNCSCGSRVLETLTQHRTTVGATPNRGSSKYSASWRSIAHSTTRGAHVCSQAIVLHVRSSAIDCDISKMRVSSSYTTFRVETKDGLRVRACWTSVTVTSGHGMIVMLSANVCIKSASASAFELVSSRPVFGPLSTTWRKPGSSVSVVSGYGLEDRAMEVRSWQRREDFSSGLCVQTGSGAHLVSCIMGTGGPFPRAKARPGPDADHSPPSSAEVENE